MTRWDEWLAAQAAARDAAGLQRTLRPRAADDPTVDLAGNDYLGLARDPGWSRRPPRRPSAGAPGRAPRGW